jgi:pimeloyl-CoA synthetase
MAYNPTVNSGATSGNHQAVTPSDSTNFTDGACLALYVGVAGDLVVVDNYGHVTTFKNAAVGYHPIRAVRVNSTSTTATNIVALY